MRVGRTTQPGDRAAIWARALLYAAPATGFLLIARWSTGWFAIAATAALCGCVLLMVVAGIRVEFAIWNAIAKEPDRHGHQPGDDEQA